MSDDDLPEAPFVASRLTTTSVYHTRRCSSVSRSGRQRLVSVSDSEINYHELTLCRKCDENFEGQTAEQAGRMPSDWLPSNETEVEP